MKRYRRIRVDSDNDPACTARAVPKIANMAQYSSRTNTGMARMPLRRNCHLTTCASASRDASLVSEDMLSKICRLDCFRVAGGASALQ